MHNNSITVLGLLKSKNVNGEGRTDTRFVYSTNGKCKTKDTDVIFSTSNYSFPKSLHEKQNYIFHRKHEFAGYRKLSV